MIQRVQVPPRWAGFRTSTYSWQALYLQIAGRSGFAQRCKAEGHNSAGQQLVGCPSRPVLTLERSLKDSRKDLELWSSGAFQGEVYPDLPVATTWPAYTRHLMQLR